MKKKILVLLMVAFIIIPLTSCSLLYPGLYNSATSSQKSELTQPVADNIVLEKPITEIQTAITEIRKKVYNSCVGIQASFSETNSGGTGSGVVYKKANGYYYVVTNNHVVTEKTLINGDTVFTEGKIKVYIKALVDSDTNADKITNGKYYSAEILGRDVPHDLAVLRFSTDLAGENGPIIPLDIFNKQIPIDTIIPGQTVIAMGCPGGFGNYNLVSQGIVSIVINGFVKHTAAINPGNSGGGLFNLDGRLIGLNFQKRTSFDEGDGSTIAAEGLGEAIGIQHLLTQIPKLEAGNNYGSKPIIGVSIGTIVRNLTEDEALLTMLPDNFDQVVYISSFPKNEITGERLKNYSSYNSNLKINDIIYKAENKILFNMDDLSNVLLEMQYGDTLDLKVIRNGEYIDISFLLTSPTK